MTSLKIELKPMDAAPPDGEVWLYGTNHSTPHAQLFLGWRIQGSSCWEGMSVDAIVQRVEPLMWAPLDGVRLEQ